MLDLSTIATVVAAVSVVVGVVFTVLELRHMTRTRQTDIIMRIYDRFGSKEMVEAIYSVGQLRSKTPPKSGLIGVIQIAIVFEGLGVLLEQDLIDIKLVDRLFGPTLDALWEPIRPLIYGMRESLKQPTFFSHFEYLHNRLNDYRKRRVV
jgi:xanthosine utilization system XapX-like protein